MVVNDLVKRRRFPVEIVACPTIRQIDGLALSSRNVYLTEDQRADAPVLYRALNMGAELIADGEKSSENLKKLIIDIVRNESKGDLDYVDVVVNVFNKEQREYYNIERLWSDAKIETIKESQ